MRAVNLLPRDEARGPRKQSRLLAGGVAAALVLATGLVALTLTESAKVRDRRATVEALRIELAAVPAPVAGANDGAALAADRNGRLVALVDVLGKRVVYDRLLRRVSAVLPGDVWLTALSAEAPAAAATAPPTGSTAPAAESPGFRIEGYTYTHDSVARLLARLQLVPDLRDVQLVTSALSQLAGSRRPVVQFSVQGSLRGGGS